MSNTIKPDLSIKRNFEIWKVIKEYPNYAISNLGKVKSLERLVPHRKTTMLLQEVFMKIFPRKRDHGYIKVGLVRNGVCKRIGVHQLVINYFGERRPSPDHIPHHKDGDKSNNWWTNLEWATYSENIKHAFDTGLNPLPKGELNPAAKLNADKVKTIRKLYSVGQYTQTILAEMFGVKQPLIGKIINKKRWRHI